MDINGFDWKKSAIKEDLADCDTNPDLERMEEAFKKSSDKSCSRNGSKITGFDFTQESLIRIRQNHPNIEGQSLSLSIGRERDSNQKRIDKEPSNLVAAYAQKI